MAWRTVLLIVMVLVVCAVVLTPTGRDWLIDRVDDTTWLLHQFRILRP